MTSSSEFRPGFAQATTDDAINMSHVNTKEQGITVNGNDSIDEAAKPELPTEGLQRGVQDVESVTRNWSKKTLVAVFSVSSQHMAALLRQRLPIFDLVQPPTVCHQRLRVACTVERHLRRSERDVSCTVYPTGQDCGCLGAS